MNLGSFSFIVYSEKLSATAQDVLIIFFSPNYKDEKYSILIHQGAEEKWAEIMILTDSIFFNLFAPELNLTFNTGQNKRHWETEFGF